MTLKEQQQQAERCSYELRVSDVPLQRNPLNGRFLKGHADTLIEQLKGKEE